MTTQALQHPETTSDTFPINGTDFVEFYVGNARQSAIFYETAFGFRRVAYRGPETGTRDRASYVLQQDRIRLVLTTAIQPDHPIAKHVLLHGDDELGTGWTPEWLSPQAAAEFLAFLELNLGDVTGYDIVAALRSGRPGPGDQRAAAVVEGVVCAVTGLAAAAVRSESKHPTVETTITMVRTILPASARAGSSRT